MTRALLIAIPVVYSFSVSYILLWLCRLRIDRHRGRRILVGVAAETFVRSKVGCPLPLREQSSASGSNGRHHHLFPNAISLLVQKFRMKEMKLSFTQGRWSYESWGGFDPIPSNNAETPGAELWASGGLRYGTLPRDAVCTKNLTPRLKFLPCRDKDGIAALMDRPSIYKGFYRSQWLHLTSTGLDDSDGVDSGIILEQTLSVVLQPHQMRALYNFPRNKITTKLPDRILEEVNRCHRNRQSLLYVFLVEKYSDSEPFDLGLTWKLPSTRLSEELLHSDLTEEKCKLQLCVSPYEDKVSPGLMELILKFPCGTKSAVVTLEFDKGFLQIDKYPPDANQGFDVPSTIISYPDFQASMQFLEDKSLATLPTLGKRQEKSSVLSYTEVLLFSLTTPDFSMLYNVITITCTVFALYFGSLLNIDAKKGSPISQFLSKLPSKLTGIPLKTPQSPSTSSSFISSKLTRKVVLVAGIAVVWKLFLE
ncbi:GPI transamidase component PIG-T [Parasponia andersonii]|uniref:GPI transamidase component PIG-T n=1 Tax=Parasponia andersonii TaxID=3476 RepID=A0A2P5DC15_PARAD|nr:GPI transamidase component PIG-T [Parasponia andersonii]